MVWEVKKLGDVCELITKGTTPTSIGFKFSDEGINFIKVESLTESGKIIPEKVAFISDECHQALKRSQLKVGDILFSIAGALGRIGIVSEEILPANTNQALAIIRLRKDTDISVNFLSKYFVSESTTKQIEKFRGGVAQQNLSLSQLNDLQIIIPPIFEQKHIVAILDEAFESITKAKENAEKNLKNANEIFESYLQSVFENKGDGWEEKKLQELSDNYKKDIVDGPFGSDLKRSHFITSGIPVLKLQNVKEGRLELKNMDYVSLEKALSLKRHAFHSGDIVMTKLGAPLGVSAIVKNISEGIIVADLVRIRVQKINTEYLCYFLNSRKIRDFINSKQKGTTRPRIRLSVVRELPIAYPNTDKGQQLMVKKLDSLSQETKKLEAIYTQKLADLEELKKSILAKAFNGEFKGASA